ncbi:MAG TPA: nuclear transport factor 2 family protein [Solirubrobacterales bacterium]
MASSSSSTASPQTDSPEAALRRFTEGLIGHDARAAAAAFAAEGVLITPDGTAVSGAGPIHEVLVQLTAQRTVLEFELARVVRVGDVALCSQRWRHCRRGPGGVARGFHATVVTAAGKSDGRWELLVASLWGAEKKPQGRG